MPRYFEFPAECGGDDECVLYYLRRWWYDMRGEGFSDDACARQALRDLTVLHRWRILRAQRLVERAEHAIQMADQRAAAKRDVST